MEHELKPIRYQSVSHKKLYTLMNRVDAVALMGVYDKQKAYKATGIDGVSNTCMGKISLRTL